MTVLLLLKCFEFFIEVSLELKHDLMEQFNLNSLPLDCVQFEGLIEDVEEIGTFDGNLQVLELAPGLDNLPVELLHAFDVPGLKLVFAQTSRFII